MEGAMLEDLCPAHRDIVETERRLLADLARAVEHARKEPGRRQALPDARVPCVARMRIAPDGGKTRDLLLGFGTLIEPRFRVTLLDWRTAPMAALFFNHDEGEAYEEEIGGRVLRGRVLQKRLLTFVEAELTRVQTPEVTLTRGLDGRWGAGPAHAAPRVTGANGASLPRKLVDRDPMGRRVPVVTDLLDAEQRAILERDAESPLLILGGAGCGKTTVALHRVAHLHHREPTRFGQRAMVVVVPEEGLVRLTAAILEELGLERVGVYTYDRWIAQQARRVFRDLPRRECPDPPGRVVHLKRHPALRNVLPDLVERVGRELAQRLDRRLAGRGAVLERWAACAGKNLVERLAALERATRADSPAHLEREVRRAFKEERSRLFLVREDLLNLFGDRELMTLAVERSGGELTQVMADAVIEHTRIQFSETAEEEFAHVDADRRQTSDGRGLDEGTPQEAAQTIDAEDYAVCFELLRLKTGAMETPRGRPGRYFHMVLDEAQDLAPIELAVLGRTLRRGGSLTVCGDRSQHIDPSACFAGWEQALVELGVQGIEPVHLRTSYRCTESVTRFAHDVLGPLAPDEMPRPVRTGPPVERTVYPTEAHAVYDLVRALSDLLEREPAAMVAVITRDAASARRIHAALDRSLPVRLVLHGEFSFTPGIDVTPVSQVKGLEFDVVIIPDAVGYVDEPDARRKLHVACTRAIEQLWVISVGRPAPLLPAG
jgi:DNA helicase-2/ATP-dependent DNA helicase PcrA